MPFSSTVVLYPNFVRLAANRKQGKSKPVKRPMKEKKAQNGLGACACFRCKSVESMRASSARRTYRVVKAKNVTYTVTGKSVLLIAKVCLHDMGTLK